LVDRHEILHDAQKCVKFYNPGPKFQVGLLKKILGAKTCKIWPDFGQLQTSTANISRTDEDIQNWTNHFVPRFLPHWANKVWWNFVH